MSITNLAASMQRAAERLGTAPIRRRRSDAGSSRLAPAIDRRLQILLGGQERPRVPELQRELAALSRRLGVRAPSRATIYNAMARAKPRSYRGLDLPEAVRSALYNVDLEAAIPGPQVAFHAFNYGDTRAASWAAGMPWLSLHHAARMRGWRSKSRGLLDAALRWRGIA